MLKIRDCYILVVYGKSQYKTGRNVLRRKVYERHNLFFYVTYFSYYFTQCNRFYYLLLPDDCITRSIPSLGKVS